MLEFGQIAAGPFAGSLLVDLGSDVVKVENPKGGDGMRGWPPLPSKDGGPVASENFASLNRNKRSITADLKNDDDVARLKELIKFTNVIVENFRAGVMGRLGLGYQALEPINPSLVYCSISGYGQSGPHADKGGVRCHGAGHQRFDERHRRSGPSAGQIWRAGRRFHAGLYAAYTITAAVMQARRTGRGAYIDCSMLGALLGVVALQTSEYFGTGKSGGLLGSAHPRSAPYQAYHAKDERRQRCALAPGRRSGRPTRAGG